jgi:hypothetical protein
MLKVIQGNRDELEKEVLRTIWLGSPEEADRLIGQLQNLPQPSLQLVTSCSKNGPLFPAPESE